ncbi:MAG: hypothetical protein GF347_02125 [Candidatus Moranbacteria bacterium]|nr:hypothetical protein [Candidatus Moranbacteria bacterium]
MAVLAKDYAIALCEQLEKQEGDFLDLGKNFINLLKKHERLEELPVIVEYVKDYYKNNKAYVIEVFVEYAEVDPVLKIEKRLKDVAQDKKIKARSQKNEDLIGGCRVVVDNVMYDASLKGDLSKLRKKLS